MVTVSKNKKKSELQSGEKRIKELENAYKDVRKEVYTHFAKVLTKSAVGATLISGIMGMMASVFRIDEVDAKNDIGKPIKVPEVVLDTENSVDKIISGYSYKYAKEHDMLWSFAANLIVICILYVLIFKKLNNNPNLRKKVFDRLAAVDELAKNELSFQNIEKAMEKVDKTAVLEIIENLTKADRKYFDEFIAKPLSIENQELALAVIRGHLQKNPRDLEKLFNAFGTENIPEEIRHIYERVRSKKMLTWDEAVASHYNERTTSNR